MSSNHSFKTAFTVAPGDVLIDRSGNEMVVLEVVDEASGDCYALYNGKVKLINARRSSLVVNPQEKNAKVSHNEARK